MLDKTKLIVIGVGWITFSMLFRELGLTELSGDDLLFGFTFIGLGLAVEKC